MSCGRRFQKVEREPPGLSARAVSGVDEDGRRANFMGSGVPRSTCSIAACSANEAEPAPLQSAVQSAMQNAMQRGDLGAGVPWAPPDARSRQHWRSYELPGTVAFAARGGVAADAGREASGLCMYGCSSSAIFLWAALVILLPDRVGICCIYGTPHTEM